MIVPMKTYRVIGIRSDGSRLHAAEAIDYERATQIKAVLIGSAEFSSVTIEPEDNSLQPKPDPEPLTGTQRGRG
jgi:hypothetical protein